MSANRVAPLALVLLLAVGCGDSASGPPGESTPGPTVDVTGTWSGTWLSSHGMGGAMSCALTQTGGHVSGTITIGGSPCFSAGNISGTVSANNLDTGALFGGNIEVDFAGTVVGNDMSGSYTTVQAGACTGDTGTWQASR